MPDAVRIGAGSRVVVGVVLFHARLRGRRVLGWRPGWPRP